MRHMTATGPAATKTMATQRRSCMLVRGAQERLLSCESQGADMNRTRRVLC